MADSDDATTPEEDMPGLLADSDLGGFISSEEEYVPPVRHRRKKNKKITRSSPSKSTRSTKRKTSAKCKPRKIVARNTTYASKQKCLDLDAIKEFLATGDCGCSEKCIRKLQRLSNEGAVDAVYKLRSERFACKFF